MTWKPDVTVAAVAERDGRFLLVEERAGGRRVVNQPAGHLEEGETLLEAIVRETLEETAWHFVPQAVVGVYIWRPPQAARTYLRVAFSGVLGDHESSRPLDRGILGTRWLTRAELGSPRLSLRSPLVTQCVDDYLAGARHPLSLITHLIAVPSTLAASG